ncbi:MAG TPA: MoaD/ThiS family protein [Euzebyales bacterium]|nr:MoaD/ThiS family protein [Euzebyales bacterium]
MTTVRIALPAHLRTLAGVGSEVRVDVSGTPTIEHALDALESAYPMLRGTIRDHRSHDRRAFMRYFACGHDLSQAPVSTPLPGPVADGTEPFCVVAAIAGG